MFRWLLIVVGVPRCGSCVNVSFPDGDNMSGVVVAEWDHTWYHVRFTERNKEFGQRCRDQIVERGRLVYVGEQECNTVANGMPCSARERQGRPVGTKKAPSEASEQKDNGTKKQECPEIFPPQDANQQLFTEAEKESEPEPDLESWKRGLEISSLAKRMAELDRVRALLLEEKQRLETAVKVSFYVHPDHVGLVIGSGGSNLALAQAIEGVRKIDIKDSEVTIYADEQRNAEAARDFLEIECIEVPVASRERSLIIGRGGKNIRDLKETAGLAKLQIDDKGNIQLLGSRRSVVLAKKSLDLVTRFLLQQDAFVQESRSLEQQVRSTSSSRSSAGPKAGEHGDYDDCYDFSDEGFTYTINVPEARMGSIIGPKGATINDIRDKTGCRIEIGREACRPGAVTIWSSSADAADEAVEWIHDLTTDPVIGSVHDGVVERVTDFGAFVTFGKREGLVHISHMGRERVEAVSDVVRLGDEVRVTVLHVDDRRRVELALVVDESQPGPDHPNPLPLCHTSSRPPPRASPPTRGPAPVAGPAVGVCVSPGGRAGEEKVGQEKEDAGVEDKGWPSVGGSNDGGVEHYAAWHQRIQQQRERARHEADMKRMHPEESSAGSRRDKRSHDTQGSEEPSARQEVAGSRTDKRSQGLNTPADRPRSTRAAGVMQGQELYGQGKATPPGYVLGRDSGPGRAGLVGAGQGRGASLAGLAHGSGGLAPDGPEGSGERERGVGGDGMAGMRRVDEEWRGRRGKGEADLDLDYSRDYTRYAPAPAPAPPPPQADKVPPAHHVTTPAPIAAGGIVQGPLRMARPRDRDGGEEGGGEVGDGSMLRGGGRRRGRRRSS